MSEYHNPACARVLIGPDAECNCVPHIPGPVDPKDARIAELEAKNERLKDGLVRIVQCHNYPLTIMATDVETGEVGPHVVDGNNAADILTIICDVFPDFGGWAERSTP